MAQRCSAGLRCVGLAVGVGAVLGVCVVPRAMAQWTADASVNTPVAIGPGDQGAPVTASAGDGATWVAFCDNSAGGGYKHVVQRLDAAGVPTFAGSGRVLSPTRTNSATFVFDMDVNASNQALVAYDNAAIYVQKVLPDGTLAWGPDGALVPGSANGLGPRVAAFADGSAVVVWATGVTLNFQRIASDGSMGAAWQLTEAGRAQSPSDMLALPNGEFILLWVRAEGTNIVTSRKGLKIQKWNASNAQVWNSGTPIDVYASSATPSRGIQVGHFPPLVSDGAGGAVLAWYDIGATRNTWLQHYASDGTARFPVNGVAASTTTTATELRLSASVAFHAGSSPALDEYTLAYSVSNPSQSQFGLSAQRIGAGGARLWGDAGLSILPRTAQSVSFSSALALRGAATGDAVVASLYEVAGQSAPRMVRLNAIGGRVWFNGDPNASLAVSTRPGGASRLSLQPVATRDMVVAVWGAGSAGDTDMVAQNINDAGTLGAPGPACDSLDFNQDGDFPTPLDLEDFINAVGGNVCGTCSTDLDFNNDGDFPTPLDIEAFISVSAGGACL